MTAQAAVAEKPTTLQKAHTKLVKVRADSLEIHPKAQRAIVQSRLAKLKANLDLDGIGIMHAVERKDKLYLVDGQHRLRALMEHCFGEWIVDVLIHLDAKDDDERACEIFLMLNDRVPVAMYDKFEAELNAHFPEAMGIVKIAEQNRLRVRRSAGDGILCCVASCKRIYSIDQGKTFDRTLKVAQAAWGDKAAALEGKLLEGVAVALRSNNGAIDHDVLVHKLSKYAGGPTGLLGDAKGRMEYEKISLARSVAAQIVSMYNVGRRTNKLAERD